MRGDEPTVPNLSAFDPREPDGTPAWPVRRGQPPRPPIRDTHATTTALLGISAGANVVLLASLVCVLLLARAGFFAPVSPSAQVSPSAATANPALSSPSAATSTPSPTTAADVSDWLQVAPTTVQVGCDDGQQTQFVVLANYGPEDVEWQADFSLPQDEAGVALSPDHGQLRAGVSITLRVQNRSHDTGQQGDIRFETSTQDAGTPPSLSYSTMGCN